MSNTNNTTETLTYDVHFNDNETSNSKGFALTAQKARDYIAIWNGTKHSYFADYKGGCVSIVCNETGSVIHEEEVV